MYCLVKFVAAGYVAKHLFKQVYRRRLKHPLAESQTALEKNTAKNDFQYGGWNSPTLCDFHQIAVNFVIFWINFPNTAQMRPSVP